MDSHSHIVPRSFWRAKGARAFDAGRSIDAHGMNHGATAIPAYKLGWIVRQAEKAGLIQVDELAMEVAP